MSLQLLQFLFVLLPVFLQGLALVFDEFYFHHKRGLPRWECWGHPLDTIVTLSALSLPLFLEFTESNLLIYAFCALFSCLFVTKDEWVHAQHCGGSENWLHAILFLMHPLVFVSFGYLWWQAGSERSIITLEFPTLLSGSEASTIAFSFGAFLRGQIGVMALFAVYQIAYWNFVRPPLKAKTFS